MKNGNKNIAAPWMIALLFLIIFLLNNVWPEKALSANLLQAFTNPKLLPQFSLYDLEGNLINIEDYKGKIILLNFWATWCPNCRQEAPFLEKLYDQFKTKDFLIFRINAKESKETIHKYLEKHPSKIAILLDEKNKVGNLMAVWAHPTSFLIDAQGRIRYRAMGMVDWSSAEVVTIIEKMLDEIKK